MIVQFYYSLYALFSVDEEGYGRCFWGSSKVTLESGKQKTVSDVKIGDSVLAVDENGIIRFSQVITQMHRNPDVKQKFQVIRTKKWEKLGIDRNTYDLQNKNR